MGRIRKDTMLLKDIVDASKMVSATTRRKEKILLLGECLKAGGLGTLLKDLKFIHPTVMGKEIQGQRSRVRQR